MTSCVLDDTCRLLVEKNMKLVPYIIGKYFRISNADIEDMTSIGNIALCCAAAKYNPDNGVTFCTYAAKSIINEIKKEFLRMSRQKRGGGMNTISLNAEIQLSNQEGPGELIDAIIDDTINIESQVTDKIIFDSIVQYVPTFMDIERQNMNISEYASKNNLPKSTAYARVRRELNKARKALGSRV